MRVLMSFAGGYGHAAPLFPVAHALARRGHEIAFTGQPAMLKAVGTQGFPTFDSDGVVPAMKPTSHMLFQPFDADGLRDRLRAGFGGQIARDRVSGVTRVAREWQPDALICDEMDFGAMLAMERLNLPHVEVSVIATGRFVTADWFGGAIDRIRTAFAMPPDPGLAMVGRHLTLSPFPPALRDPACPPPANTRFFRSEPVDRQDARETARARPKVYMTFGTEFGLLAIDFLRMVLDGLSGLDIDVVAAVGDTLDHAEFGPQPANVDIRRFVDQAALLGSCDLMVSHGGSGSMLGGLAHGLPMMLCPMGADQHFNAERGEALGFARSLDPRVATADRIGAMTRGLLEDGRSKASASVLRRAIADLPDVASVVAAIEAAVG